MKGSDPIKGRAENHLIQSGRRETDEAKLLNSQAKIKAFVNTYENFGDYNFSDLG